MNNNQSLREFLGGQAANKVDNSTDGQQMKETFQDNYFCCFWQFRLILSGKNRIFCTAGFALSGVQGACQSGLPAEKIESLLWTQLLEFVFYWSLSLLQALGSAAVFLAIDLVFLAIDLVFFFFFLIYFFLSIWAECQKLCEAICITHILGCEVLYCLAVFFFLSPLDETGSFRERFLII